MLLYNLLAKELVQTKRCLSVLLFFLLKTMGRDKVSIVIYLRWLMAIPFCLLVFGGASVCAQTEAGGWQGHWDGSTMKWEVSVFCSLS